MTLIFNPEVQNATLNTVRDAIDSGGSAGILEILSGATILATLPLSIPSFADESGGQSVANAIISSVATESGTPDGFRFVTSYGATVFAGDVPDDLDIGGAAISSGQTVGVSSYALTQGDVQTREFASTVAFPYSTPPLVFDPTPAPSALVDPKDLKLELLRGQDFESDGTTLRTATYDGANVLLDGVPLFAAPDVKALDLTFDASDNALVVFTDSGDNLFVYDDSDQATADLTATGQDPRIHNDRQAEPSVVLSYRRGSDVFYRLKAPDGIPPPPTAPAGTVTWMEDNWITGAVGNAIPSFDGSYLDGGGLMVDCTAVTSGSVSFRTALTGAQLISALGFTPSQIFVRFEYSTHGVDTSSTTYCVLSVPTESFVPDLGGPVGPEPPPSGTDAIGPLTNVSTLPYIELLVQRNNRPLGVFPRTATVSYVGFVP